MAFTRQQIRESIERAGDEHWQALIRHHEDAYPESRPTPGDVARAEAERLNDLGLGDDPDLELVESRVEPVDSEVRITHVFEDRAKDTRFETRAFSGLRVSAIYAASGRGTTSTGTRACSMIIGSACRAKPRPSRGVPDHELLDNRSVAAIGFLHTSPAHVATFRALLDDVAPDVDGAHVVDADLLTQARTGRRGRRPARAAAAPASRSSPRSRSTSCSAPARPWAATLRRSPHGFTSRCCASTGPWPRPPSRSGGRVAVVAAVASTLTPTRRLLEEQRGGGGDRHGRRARAVPRRLGTVRGRRRGRLRAPRRRARAGRRPLGRGRRHRAGAGQHGARVRPPA